jgi:predicted RNA-binding Zn ribbon-like protein
VSFDLSSGALCLDFTNTWGDRAREETDALLSYGALLTFASQAGLVSLEERARLEALARQDPVREAAVFSRAREMRERIYGIFAAVAATHALSAEVLAPFNELLPPALARLQVAPGGDRPRWGWAGVIDHLESPLWPVVHSAAELLVSPNRERVRECGGNACTWLFLDHSRNQMRRWCSMKTCGNRAKARRHYRRHLERSA